MAYKDRHQSVAQQALHSSELPQSMGSASCSNSIQGMIVQKSPDMHRTAFL